MNNYIQSAEEEFAGGEELEISFEEYIDYIKENPSSAVGSVQYVVDAIENFGKRTVVEHGEEKERYRFFDDPSNNGEHAVLGHTEELNSFVESLKRKTKSEGENNRIVWISGPTATGKSEFKRCLFNGVKAYAQTDEGRRFTLKWSLDSLGSSGFTYGEGDVSKKNWYKSPVNVSPLSVLPDDTRQQIVDDIGIEFEPNKGLDPFSREAYEYLEEVHDSFEDIISEDYLKVVSYIPEVGDGLGVLHSEDGGQPKDKIVGSWMQGANEEFQSRGRRNAQSFTYDGVLSQGNGCVSVIEDAYHHHESFQKLMNVCEEDMVKLDKKISMQIDSLIICIANPDFEAQLNRHDEELSHDPFRAIRRRLEKYNFDYLTSITLETQLLRRHIAKENCLWDDMSVNELLDKSSESIEVFGTHFAPHTLETVALFSVLTRLDPTRSSEKGGFLDGVDIALFFDRGYHIKNGERKEYDADLIATEEDGKEGIPVTYTSQVLSELAQTNENDVVMPYDALDKVVERIKTNPIFTDFEFDEYKKTGSETGSYMTKQLRQDVIEAMLDDNVATEDDVVEYVESLLAWDDGEDDDYDQYELREFEIKHLDMSERLYDGGDPHEDIETWRINKIISPINKHIWQNKDKDFEEKSIPIRESHVLNQILKYDSWRAVDSAYDNLDLSVWKNPPEGSQTDKIKQQTIENMKEMGYNDESAEKATVKVFETYEPDIGD